MMPGAILEVILDKVHYARKMDLDTFGIHKGHMPVTCIRQSIVTAVLPHVCASLHHARTVYVTCLGCTGLDSTCGRTASPMSNIKLNAINSHAISQRLRKRCNYRRKDSLELHVKRGANLVDYPAHLMQMRAPSDTDLLPLDT